MKGSQIKILSKGIISGRLKGSNILLFLMILNAALFTVLPFLINLLTDGYSPKVKMISCVCAAAVILLLNMLAFSSFGAGSCAWFLFYNKKNRLGRTVFWFKPFRSFKAAGLYVSLFLRKALITGAFLLPGAVTLASFVILAMNGGVEFNLFLAGISGAAAMLIIGALFAFICVQRYFLTPYIVASNPKIKIKDAVSQSKILMNGRMKKTAGFKLSFMPWFILCAAVLPIYYVWPYYKQSCAVYAKQAVNHASQKNTAKALPH